MYTYLETFLGETARVAWKKFKEIFPKLLTEDMALRNNLHNFTNRIQSLLIAQNPNRGTLMQQQKSIRKLEQLSISNWDQIKNFIQEYTYYALLAGCFYDEEIIKKLVLKLSG